MVTLQTKATKAFPDPDPPAVAPIDPEAADAAVEQTRFDHETARRAEIIRSAQEALSVQIRRQFIKNVPGWLRAKLLEQPRTTSVEDLSIFARKLLLHLYMNVYELTELNNFLCNCSISSFRCTVAPSKISCFCLICSIVSRWSKYCEAQLRLCVKL